LFLPTNGKTRKGVHTLDIAKRLIDYGFHPMTIYFPLIVQGAMLIEPTDRCRQELDQFIEAMRSIAQEAVETPELVLNAPHDTRIGRLDELLRRASQCCAGSEAGC